MDIRYYKEEDYKTFLEFWGHYNRYSPKKEMLSPVGIVVEVDGVICGGAWLYIMQGCDIVQIAWTTLNPDLRMKKKYLVLEAINDAIVETCKKLKKENLIMFCDVKGLNKFFKKKGYGMCDPHSLLIGAL